jgi:hypothetical protein
LVEEQRNKGLGLPERVRQSLASAVEQRGVQARIVSIGSRKSVRPPQAHVIVAGKGEEIDSIRGPAKVVRQLEFYRTPYGPVVRLAFSVYPQEGEPLSADTIIDVSQLSGDTALSGLGRQKTLYVHFYRAENGDLSYGFSKELTNASEQRSEAKKVLKMARGAYSETPEDHRSFRWATGIAEKQFELPVSEPDK